MGEIAEMMLDGILDCETGEFIDGKAPGYPRTVADAEWDDDFGVAGPLKARRQKAANTRVVFKTPCPVCGKGFRGDGGVKNHMAVKHPAESGALLERARLSDAAPDLLAALQSVMWMAEEWFKYSGCDATCADEYRLDLDRAKAAISKAEGK